MKQLGTHEDGFVLLNALVIVAALSMVAVFMLQSAETSSSRLRMGNETAQAGQYLDGMETLLASVLAADMAAGDTDNLQESWARTTYSVPVDRGAGAGALTDLQGRFNINWLVDPNARAANVAFVILLKDLGISPNLGASIIEYLALGGPSNRTPYTNRQVPRHPPGGPISVVSELRSVQGMTPSAYRRLAPYLAALPQDTALNVNTAPAPVLAGFLPKVERAGINILLQERRREPYESLQALFEKVTANHGLAALDYVEPALLSVTSNWFGAKITATLGTSAQSRYVIFKRLNSRRSVNVALRLPIQLTPYSNQDGL